MHCGLCLPACPTYVLTGLEKSSPRGRIRLMKAVADGELVISDAFEEEMYFCLDCQACESACPAGVKYGSLVESARALIMESKRQKWSSKIWNRILLGWFLGSRQGVRWSGKFLLFFQESGLIALLKRTRALAILSRKLQKSLDLLPAINPEPTEFTLSKKHHPLTEKRIKVGFLTGCIMDVMFPDVNADTIFLLKHHGCEVVVPEGQACCGSLQAHCGDVATARRLAAQNIRVFKDLDEIVMNSAGCGAFMKQYGELLADDPQVSDLANDVAAKVRDLSEFLVEIGLDTATASGKTTAGKRVTYHDACHLVHAQKVSDQPRRLIKSLPDVHYVELPESTWCCGSAGVYNITHAETADLLLDRKMQNLLEIDPDIVVTSNPGCMLQLRLGIERYGIHSELLHLATFLRRACCE